MHLTEKKNMLLSPRLSRKRRLGFCRFFLGVTMSPQGPVERRGEKRGRSRKGEKRVGSSVE